MYSVDELMQILMTDDRIFANCCLYFIEDVTSCSMEAELRENGNERYTLSRYMASWIPWEPNADKIIAQIKEWADK